MCRVLVSITVFNFIRLIETMEGVKLGLSNKVRL